MQNLFIKGNSKTPEVDFNVDTGKLQISGISIPEHTLDFYNPIFSFLEEYAKSPCSSTEITFNLQYFNTSTSKSFVNVFKILQTIDPKKSTVVVNWCYEKEDEDMLDCGHDFQSISSLKFNMVELEEL